MKYRVMKYSAGFYTLIVILAIFLFPLTSYADTAVTVSNNSNGSSSNVSVNSQTSGQSTVCVNGKCTTSGGGGKATVCVNGKCTTSDNGNVDYQSEDGHNQVHIQSNTSGNSVSNSPKVTQPSPPSDTPESTVSSGPSMTPDPTIAQMRHDINTQVEKQLATVKEHMKNQEAALSAFMKEIQNFLNGLFK